MDHFNSAGPTVCRDGICCSNEKTSDELLFGGLGTRSYWGASYTCEPAVGWKWRRMIERMRERGTYWLTGPLLLPAKMSATDEPEHTVHGQPCRRRHENTGCMDSCMCCSNGLAVSERIVFRLVSDAEAIEELHDCQNSCEQGGTHA